MATQEELVTMVEEVFREPPNTPPRPPVYDPRTRPDFQAMVEKGRALTSGIVTTRKLGIDKFVTEWKEYNESHGAITFREYMDRIPMPPNERIAANQMVEEYEQRGETMVEEAKEEKEETEREKTPSERLRGAIWYLSQAQFKRKLNEEDFKVYYENCMDRLIQQMAERTKALEDK